MNNIDEVVVTRTVKTPEKSSSCGGGSSKGIGAIMPPINILNWYLSLNPVPKAKKLTKDPCEDSKELNNRQNNNKNRAKNKTIIDKTAFSGKEHAYSTIIDFNTGNIITFTDVRVGVVDGTHHTVPQDYGFDYKTDSGIRTITQITAIYTHTHGFNSAPSAYDIFAGIEPYMDNLLNSTQKSKYLGYHSINVLTTNASYSITITDPSKWVNRNITMTDDMVLYNEKTIKYMNSGLDREIAQERALLEIYGDMINLYKSSLGDANFKPIVLNNNQIVFIEC